MKVLQVTNIVSHMQLPLAHCLADALGPAEFHFGVTQPPDPERVRLGWDPRVADDLVLRPAERGKDRREFVAWWAEADVVLCGERLLRLFRGRLAAGKLLFYMSERWWKPPIGAARLFDPRFLRMALGFRRLAASPAFHYLPIGGYAARDMRHLAPLPGRVWEWGYFVEPGDGESQRSGRDGRFHVLWAGRMLNWKRVDTLIRGFSVLRDAGGDARLTLIGLGPREAALRRLAESLGLQGDVAFLPSLPVTEVRAHMRSADVYVLPSNGYEGWGAVLNEAMSEGCAVVACEEAGAARTLIRDGKNGRLFRAGDWRNLGGLLQHLRDNPVERKALAAAGRRTISDVWSPGVASSRFLQVCDALLGSGTPPAFVSGPMSQVGA